MAAKAAVAKLLRLLPPLDVSEPKDFIAAMVMIFAAYPSDVWAAVIDPVRGIPGEMARPTLADIKGACERAYEPIERRLAHDRLAQNHRLALAERPHERTPEDQARAEAQVEDWHKIRPPVPVRSFARRIDWGDGKHGLRVEAALADRRRRAGGDRD